MYNISLADYEQLFAEQRGLCIGCLAPPEEGVRFDVDHDHATGEVRGLLCNRCNNVLSKAKDNPEILRRLASYLDEHQAKLRVVA